MGADEILTVWSIMFPLRQLEQMLHDVLRISTETAMDQLVCDVLLRVFDFRSCILRQIEINIPDQLG